MAVTKTATVYFAQTANALLEVNVPLTATSSTIQALIDANTTNGAVLRFGSGTYDIDDEIALKSNVTLRGNGDSTILQVNTALTNNIFVATAQTRVAVENLVIDYQSNASGRHIIDFGTNAKFATVDGVIFRGLKTRAAITANYQTGGVADPDNGNILIEGCRVEDGDSAGLFVIYGQSAVPAYNVRIKNNYVYGGGSIAHLVSDSPEFDAFIDGEFTGNTIIGNGTGTFGAIPCELWGITDWVINDNIIKDATRGIGVTRGKNYVVSNNSLEDQTTYAFEIGSPDNALYTDNVALRCKTLAVINPAGEGAYYCSVVNNQLDGTGLASESAEYALKMATGTHLGHRFAGNKFIDIEYLNGAILVDGTDVSSVNGIVVEDNEVYASTVNCPITAVSVRRATTTKVSGNYVYFSANYTSANPQYNENVAFFSAVMGGDVANVDFHDNSVVFLGTAAGSGVAGIGTNNSTAAGLVGMTVLRNSLQGTFSAPLRISSTTGDTIVLDNDTSKVTGSNSFNAAVVLKRTNNTYSASAVPATGAFVIGDWVWNVAGTISGGKVLIGWYRLTTGSGHTPGTDWTPMYATTT